MSAWRSGAGMPMTTRMVRVLAEIFTQRFRMFDSHASWLAALPVGWIVRVMTAVATAETLLLQHWKCCYDPILNTHHVMSREMTTLYVWSTIVSFISEVRLDQVLQWLLHGTSCCRIDNTASRSRIAAHGSSARSFLNVILNEMGIKTLHKT
jgi:hypothetical protein